MAVALVNAAAAPEPVPSTSLEMRAMWVPRTALTSPDSIATLVRSAQASGFNALFVQVRGRGEAFYRSRIEPRATELDRQALEFDPLQLLLDLGHAAGLQVHAWVNVNLVASSVTLPRDANHVALRHPEWLMTPKALGAALRSTSPRSPAYLGTLSRWTRAESARVEGLYLSPISADARKYTTAVIREMVEQYAVDGLHLDYIRYPHEDFDYSPAALAEFRAAQLATLPLPERTKLDGAVALDPSAWATQRPQEWAAFRRDCLTLLVAGLQAAARDVRPALIVSAAVVPSAEDARNRKLQDWPVWARAGYFDALSPMIYTSNTQEFAAALDQMPGLLGDTPFWAGIGAYRLPLSRTIDHVRLARRSQAAGFILFSYDKLADDGTAASALTALAPVLIEAPASGGRRSPR
jgi:uncharacterized lipoprotein YddW (UPF0748 family)